MKRELVRIPVSSVRVDENQPRKDFVAIDEFATSLEVDPNIEMPIIVEDLGNGSYFLVDGERRLRAAQKAGLGEIWADVRKSLNDVDREVMRGRINFQRRAWKEGESVIFINRLYDKWLKQRFNERRGSETKNRRKQFSQLIGIGERYLDQLLGLDEVSTSLLERGISTHAAEHISHKSTDVQRAIIEEAEEIRKRDNKKKITRPILNQAREQVDIKKAPTKQDQDREALEDIRKAFRFIVDETSIIRDRSKYLYAHKSAQEALDMMDSTAQALLGVEKDIQNKFLGLKPRRKESL